MNQPFWQPEYFPLPGDAWRRSTGREELVIVLAVTRRRNAPRVYIADVSGNGVEFKDLSVRLYRTQVDSAEAEFLATEGMQVRSTEDEVTVSNGDELRKSWPISVPARLVALVGKNIPLSERPEYERLDDYSRNRHDKRRSEFKVKPND